MHAVLQEEMNLTYLQTYSVEGQLTFWGRGHNVICWSSDNQVALVQKKGVNVYVSLFIIIIIWFSSLCALSLPSCLFTELILRTCDVEITWCIINLHT